ncbi:MAG: hypothetical protein ABI390_09650 [Daejeonella sp.]
MKNRIHTILNIKYSESNQVFDLLGVQFFIGLATSFVSIVAITLFLYSFSIEMLPLAYVIIAAFLLIINLSYEKLEHKFSAFKVLRVIIVFSVVILLCIWIGLALGSKHTFIFTLLVWSTLFYMISGYAFWGLVSQVFNVRESKRVFSVVGAGDIPAKLIGYLTAPVFISIVGLNNMLWLAVLSLGIAYFLFSRFLKKQAWINFHESNTHKPHVETQKPYKRSEIISFLFKNELIFAISIISLLSYNVFNLVDYTFLAEVKHKYEDIADLAAFIAVFFAAGRFIALILKLIFTSRAIEKLGIIYCLLITPIALLLFSGLFFIYGGNSNFNIYIFGMMALFTEVLRSTMQEPVFFILFQPLKEQLRLKGHLISKGYMLAPSLIIVGLSLYFLPKFGIPITILLTVKVLLINLVVWAAIIYYVKSSYLKTLRSSISRGVFSSNDIQIYDDETIKILLNKIAGGKKMEVIYALKLLENAEYESIDNLLENQLSTENQEIKLYVLDRLEARKKINSELFKEVLITESDVLVIEKMVAILCRFDKDFLKEKVANLALLEDSIKKVIIINLLNQNEFNYLLKAGNEISSLIYSSKSVNRELALNIIAELKQLKFTDIIENLMNDDDLNVRKKAIVVACKLNISKLLPIIINKLNDPSEKYLILQGLGQYGDNLYKDILTLPQDIYNSHLNNLIKLSGKINGPNTTEFLIRTLDVTHIQTDKIIHALWVKQFEVDTPKMRMRLEEILKNSLNIARIKLVNYFQVPVCKEEGLIKNSMYNEVLNDLITSLKICFLLHRRNEVNRLIELLNIEKQDKIFNAMEMLDLVIPKRLAKEINYLVDFILDPEGNIKDYRKLDIKPFFNTIINTESEIFNSWTKAVCIYSAGKLNESQFVKRLTSQPIEQEDLIISETRDYIINGLKTT